MMPSSRPASVPADILAPSISISHVQEEEGSSSADSNHEGGEERRRVGPFAHLGCEGCLAGTCISESEAKMARDEEAASEEEVVRLARLLDSLQERLNSLQVSHNTTVRNTQREIITLDLQGGAVEGMLRDVERVRDVAVDKAKKAFDNRESLRRELGQSQVGLVGRFGARKYRMMKREERIEDKWAGVVDTADQQPTDGDRKSSTPSRSPTDGDHHRASVASAGGTSTSSAAVNRFSKTHSVASSQQKNGGSKQSMSRRKSKLTDAVSQYLEKKPSASKRKGSGGSKLSPHIEESNGLEVVAVPPLSDDQPRKSDESEALDTVVESQKQDTVESVVRSLDRQSMAEKGEAVLEWYKQKQLALTDKPTSTELTPTKQTTPALVPTPPPTTLSGGPSAQSRLMSSRHLQAAQRSITNQAALLRPSERGINSTTTE